MDTAPGTNSQFLPVHPVLMANDVPRSISFFVELGFATLFLDDPGDPRYACVERDNVEIHIQWNEAPGTVTAEERPAYRFLVRDVDALYQELSTGTERVLAAAHVTPWHAPADTPWGTREFHVRDPSGNGLQFYQSQRRSNPGDA